MAVCPSVCAAGRCAEGLRAQGSERSQVGSCHGKTAWRGEKSQVPDCRDHLTACYVQLGSSPTENPAGNFSQELRKKGKHFLLPGDHLMLSNTSFLNCNAVLLCCLECCNSTFSLFLLCRFEKKKRLGLETDSASV